MSDHKPAEILEECITLGERIVPKADEGAYSEWNDAVLGVLKVVFSQSSEQFMGFRFASQAGAVSGDTPEEKKRGRIRNTIRGKVLALQAAVDALEADQVAPALGWAQSYDELQQRLAAVARTISQAEAV